MNAYTLIASLSLALAAAAPVLAQEATLGAAPFAGQASRAEVASGARLALLAGQQHEAWQIQQTTPVRHSQSRDQVRADTLAALRSGEVRRLDAQAPALGLIEPASIHALQLAGLSR